MRLADINLEMIFYLEQDEMGKEVEASINYEISTWILILHSWIS